MRVRLTAGRTARAAAGLGALALVLGAGAAAAPTASAQQAPDDSTRPAGWSCKDGGTGGAGAGRVLPGTDVDDPSALSAAEAEAVDDAYREAVRENGRSLKRGGTITIPVVFHVITQRDGTGKVPQSRLDKQLAVMNRGFSGAGSDAAVDTGIQFEQVDKTVTKNNNWYDWNGFTGGSDDRQAKTRLHQGGAETLNVYITGLRGGLLGYATFPGRGRPVLDGVVVLNKSLPGGNIAKYNRGDTLTHEVGHWLNLFHTFQGGCSKRNDRVADTPAQDDGQNVFSCNERLNTCRQAGRDPVHNFMSYGSDLCLDRYTAGQTTRMQRAYLNQRNPI